MYTLLLIDAYCKLIRFTEFSFFYILRFPIEWEYVIGKRGPRIRWVSLFYLSLPHKTSKQLLYLAAVAVMQCVVYMLIKARYYMNKKKEIVSIRRKRDSFKQYFQK